MPALVGDLDEQVAVHRVSYVDLGQVAEHDLHECVLEPDPSAEHRRGLVTAVRDPFGLGHGIPGISAEEREKFRRHVKCGVVDGDGPIDLAERIVRRALGRSDELFGTGGGCGHVEEKRHAQTMTLTVVTVNIYCQ